MEDVSLNFEQLQAALTKPGSRLPFLQLLTAGQRKVSFGTGTLTWPGAAQFSNSLTLAHGLAATPLTVQAFSQLPGGGAPVEMHWVSVDATNVVYRGHTTDGSSPANTVTTSFFWLAIG